ncbi:MAG: VCBS repeat-containing protein, partial [Balneolales bacterium]
MLLNFKALFTGLFICFCLISGCTSNSEVSWNEEEGYRWTELDIGYFGSTGFSKLDKTGIQFDNSVREELVEENRHFLNGSGVAVGDVTGDGLVDIYFASLDGTNKLYENRGGFKFTDITEEAGLAHEGYSSTGVVFADVNANGHLDLLITSLTETNSLYINDGDGHFELKENSGLGDSKGAKTMALADITGNGHLDLYIANYKYETVKDLYTSQELSLDNTLEYLDGELHVKSPFDQYYNIINTANGPYRNEVGEADELYLNKGNGVFEKADDAVHFFDEDGNERGLSKDWGLTANFQDVTGDMLPDLYVANDFWTSDRLWINQGDGTFRLIETDAIQNMSFSAMGIDFSDVNRNGSMDFVVTEMLGMEHKNRIRQFSDYLEQNDGRTLNNRNSLFINRGDNTFSETAYYSGLQASEWSWATSFMDIDLDGYEDLIIATGFANDYTDMDTQIALVEQDNDPSNSNIISYPPLKRTNKIFRNNRDLTFTDKSNDWGFDVEDVSLGMALADLNNDGTLDVILNRYNEEAAVYENRTNAPRIAVHLNGNAPNTHGIGAKVKLEGGPVEQSKEMVSGGNYLSGSQAQVTFAADIENTDHEITVLWPSGRQSRISGLKANRMYIIDESASTEEVKPSLASDITPLFEDVSERINHRHYENDYDDFKYFPLLPKKLSQQGPGVAWIDYNQNGLDDLFIGSGKGGNLTIYENSGNGMFTPKSMNPATEQAPGDQTSIIGWGEGNYTKVIVGSANYEQGDPATASAYQYSIDKNGNVETDSLPGVLSTTGPMAATDYNGDGYVDLFIGGNFKPGQYPGNADSRLFRYADGKLVLDEANSRTLSEIGLVSGAVFTDYNQNGSQDLLISTEWGSLKLFENRNGRFHEITEEVGLDAYTGWWNGIATGDFTNNGFPDIIAT